MIEVVTVYTPRPKNAQWKDYLPLLALQKRSVEKFGHRHIVVSDAEVPGFEVLRAELPGSLMHAIMAGQLAYLEAWSGKDPAVLVDADVLIGRDLAGAFDDGWDLGLTSRVEPRSPINNGLMYLNRGGKERALRFFRAAYALCENHWGGDQEAISQAAAPVHDKGIHERKGALVKFLPCKHYNMTPTVNGIAGKGKPFGIHFKGERKGQMAPFAAHFLGLP